MRYMQSKSIRILGALLGPAVLRNATDSTRFSVLRALDFATLSSVESIGNALIRSVPLFTTFFAIP
jgi:hypothetical protein